jgi:hypothetical protein
MTLEIAVLIAVLAAIALVFIPTLSTGASPLPTSAAVRKTTMELLPPEIDGPIYELGAGWGGLATALARRYPASPVVAFEVSPLPWAFSRLRQFFGGPGNLTFILGNFHRADLGDAAMVTCYLPPPAIDRLKTKLQAELPTGALVLSNTFKIRGWRPVGEMTASDAHLSRVYLYRAGES